MHLEKLYADTGKHELKERGDDQDVADGPDGHKHTLHHVLKTGENTLSFRKKTLHLPYFPDYKAHFFFFIVWLGCSDATYNVSLLQYIR